jgi:hypothetical protein
MPNRNYNRGKTFERRVAAIYHHMGWFAQCSAGSHGVDVVAVSPALRLYHAWMDEISETGIGTLPTGLFTHFSHFTHCKTNGHISTAERCAAIEEAHLYGAIPMLAYKGKGKERGWIICKEMV